MHREIEEKAKNCTSCRAAGETSKTQIPHTEKNRLKILNGPKQEIQLDFAGPIKSKTRGDVSFFFNFWWRWTVLASGQRHNFVNIRTLGL